MTGRPRGGLFVYGTDFPARLLYLGATRLRKEIERGGAFACVVSTVQFARFLRWNQEAGDGAGTLQLSLGGTMSDAKRRALLETNAAHLEHPNVAAFLRAIAEAEGGGYDFKCGALKGRLNDPWRFSDTSTHPGAGIDGKTTAAGMYQITRPTWQHYGGKLGLEDFSPRTQDLIAVEILRSLGVIEEIKEGEIAAVMPKVAPTWAALPKGPGQGNHYPHQRHISFERFVASYLQAGGAIA